MNRFRIPNGKNARVAGSILVATGGFVLVAWLPGWLWVTILGVVMIATGIVLLRIQCR